MSSLASSGTAQSSSTHSKSVANDAETAIFTFPLASGAAAAFILHAGLVAKKTTDYSVASYVEPFVIYNNGGSLVVSVTGNHLSDSGASMISEDKYNLGAVDVVGVKTPKATLLAGVVTVTYNPGDVGTTPDSITLNYLLENLNDVAITYL